MLVIQWLKHISVFVKKKAYFQKLSIALLQDCTPILSSAFSCGLIFSVAKLINLVVRKHYEPHCVDIKHEVKHSDGGSQDG